LNAWASYKVLAREAESALCDEDFTADEEAAAVMNA
jgi:hypothetical protein